MGVTLAKGGNVLLADEAPGLTSVRIGIGWQSDAGSAAVEIDAVVSIAEDAPGRMLLLHQVPNPDESLAAPPATGPPVGDVERVLVTLDAVPPSVTRLSFGAAIYDADARRQTFRSVRGAYIRVVDHSNGIELARYTLELQTGSETSMKFGDLYRHPKGWKFRAVGQGYAAGLRGVVVGGEARVVRPVEVTEYLRRLSPARTRRSLAEHLEPPRVAPPSTPAAQPTTPRPAPSTAQSQPAAGSTSGFTPQPNPGQPSPAQPSRPTSPAPPRHPSPPAPPRTPSRAPSPPAASPPARPAPPSAPAPRPAPPAPARSALDLSPPDPPASSRGGSNQASAAHGEPGSGEIEYGEHSSRARQRAEHVPVLDDDHPVTTWTAADRGTGGMTITLRWEALQTARGLPRPSDLHLGAFWQAGDRSEGVLQTLGNTISAPGAAGPRQVLRLGRRDEREGQTIFVDLATLPTFRRFFVFAFGQHGSPEWAQLRPELVVTAPSGEYLAMRLGEAPAGARLCVVASFSVVGPDLVMRREDDYLVDAQPGDPPAIDRQPTDRQFVGLQADAAERYGWALDWNPDGMTLRSAPGSRR